MNTHDDAIAELAALQHASVDSVRRTVGALRDQVGISWFYIFWVSGGGGGEGQQRGRTRTLLAFRTADAALTFAQRNQLATSRASSPRVRRLSIAQLLLAMAREPAIAAIRLVRDDEPPAAGHMPESLLVERAAVLAQLHP